MVGWYMYTGSHMCVALMAAMLCLAACVGTSCCAASLSGCLHCQGRLGGGGCYICTCLAGRVLGSLATKLGTPPPPTPTRVRCSCRCGGASERKGRGCAVVISDVLHP
jgi:hypothetical protein